jgi:ectoine hydroxylase-related dioxygenase (phytanoyl-CoA dioxygenase family)
MRNGLTVVAYNLHDVNPGDGGFGCVPGSHKSNYPFPNEWRDLGEAREIVRAVTGKAGTAIIFTEALAHGTMPWRGAHERRTLFYKYCPHPLSWSRQYYRAEEYPAATPTQKDLLLPPSSRHGKHRDY